MYKNADGEVNIPKVMIHSFIGVVVFILVMAYWPLVSVGAGQRGVVTVFGKVQEQVLDSGLHLVNPLAKVHKISVQTSTIDQEGGSSLAAASKDLQDVKIDVVVAFHLPETMVKEVYQQYQGIEAFQNNKLSPIVREAVKSISAQYTAEELVTKRTEVSNKIDQVIIERFEELNTVAESFKIVNLTFSPQFTQAIEAKATAVQNAEAAKNKLEQVKYEQQAVVVEANAKAEAIKIQAQAITQQGGADYVKLQAIAKWDGKLPVQMIPGSAVPFLDLNK